MISHKNISYSLSFPKSLAGERQSNTDIIGLRRGTEDAKHLGSAQAEDRRGWLAQRNQQG